MKRSFPSRPVVLLTLLTFLMICTVQCGKKPGHDKTPYILKKKLALSAEQAKGVEGTIEEMKNLREQERAKYAGDSEALVKAAKAREALEQEKIESILDAKQKAEFRKLMAEWSVTDHTLLISEWLGLDGTTTRRIDKIVVRAPTEDEMIAARKSGDPEKWKTVTERADKIHAEIESFLTAEQREAFEELIRERMARLEQTAKPD